MTEQKVDRVIDLIVQLEKGDPTVPVEVWTTGVGGHNVLRSTVIEVKQMTPALLESLHVPDDRDQPGPLPTVLFVEPK